MRCGRESIRAGASRDVPDRQADRQRSQRHGKRNKDSHLIQLAHNNPNHKVQHAPDHQTTVIPPATQQQVFTEYRIRNPAVQAKYDVDYLVPIGLGGARSIANMWPAALKGTGFFEKIQLDHVMRDMVCRRELSLRRAQHDLEQNWYAAWLKYVVATGRA